MDVSTRNEEELLEGTGVTVADAEDTAIAPWDAIQRPDKPLCECSSYELMHEAVQLAAVYLTRAGYTGTRWSDQDGTHLRCVDPRTGEDVLVQVRCSLQLGAYGLAMPELEPTPKEVDDLRWALAGLARQCECAAGGYRADVMAIDIVGERTAKLRHLMGAAWLGLQ